ncbi:transcriptional regulator family: Fungal Specific TF [Aspergillus niger]|nr:transcriptional regulator family: Fungal Specific TF [Aspergillus niger]KAI2856240.1 transcriptional regulator family: Fungal Specific TF [Aspergillus niger]KAI2879152.1 transcriptional regulator family: Fungal Specific TF [Aspergillus niger]KAI2906378.1 transcriptional regulator family: Fungal Specific TF [Aspergillus niger]
MPSSQSQMRPSPTAMFKSNRIVKASRNSGSRLSSSTLARINPGLQRLAKFMEQAKAYEASSSHSPSSSSPDSFSSTSTTQPTPAANTSAPPHNPRSEEDALILDNGVPHFVSGKHWAWMAAELQDIQSVLTESQKSSSPEGTLDDVIWEADSPAKASFSNISNNFWPDTREDCYLLLNVYLANVDPIVRIIHRPSLARRFDAFVRSQYPDSRDYTPTQGGDSNGGTSCGPTKIDAFQPLVMSIFYAAVNSIKDTDVATMFGMDKVSLLNRYRMGTEMLLKRQKFMTSRIFEVLQAFVILLTAQYREDDMGKVWPLTGLAIRIAMLQGLHRDPLALPLGTIDVVQVELRRRLWAQICYLDFRTAEDHGFAPSIHASDFDTRRPVSLDDVDLIEGVAPLAGLSDASKFTDMTIYLLRITAAGYYGHIIQITHASRKRLRNGLNGSVIDESQSLVKLQELLQTATGLAGELERGLDELVRYCDKRVVMQSMALDLSQHLKTKFWVMFWMQIPRQNREKIISPAMRRNIFVDAATASRISEAWMEDLRQRGLQLANAIYDLRGHHTTGAWPAIMWLVNRIRFQQDPAEDSRPLMAAGAVVGGNGGTGPGGPSDTQPSIMRPAGPAGAGGVDDAPPVGPAGLEFDTGDLMGLIDLEDFDFSDFIVMDGMGLPGLSR